MTKQIDYEKLWLTATPDELPWWEGNKRGELLVRRCTACDYKFFPVHPACPHCQSMVLDWFKTSGRGLIYTYFVPYQAIIAAFAPAIPYVGLVVELPDTENADGTRAMLPGMLLDDEDAAAIGAPVEVVFETTAQEDFVMPRWRIAGSTAGLWKFTD